MADREKACALLVDAERIGLLLGYDAGFLVVTRREPDSPRNSDAVQAERAIIEQLGEYRSDVFELAAAKARAARADTFIGQQAFVPKERIIGNLAACDLAGKLTVSYFPAYAPDARNTSSCDVDGDQLFIVVDGDQEPDPASSIVSPWLDDERFRQLLVRAEAMGLRLALDSAFILVKWWPVAGLEKPEAEAMIHQLGRRISEVGSHLFALARGAGGGAFVGQRVFVPELGFGILASCNADGNVEVTYRHRQMDSRMTSHCNGKSILVLVDCCQELVPASSVTEKSEWTWRGLIQKALGGRRRIPSLKILAPEIAL